MSGGAEKSPLDLDILLGEIGGAITTGGVTYPVRRLRSVDVKALRGVDWKNPSEEHFDRALGVAEQLVVGMTAEQVRTLPVAYVGAILAVAATDLEEVEATLPKAAAAVPSSPA